MAHPNLPKHCQLVMLWKSLLERWHSRSELRAGEGFSPAELLTNKPWLCQTHPAAISALGVGLCSWGSVLAAWVSKHTKLQAFTFPCRPPWGAVLPLSVALAVNLQACKPPQLPPSASCRHHNHLLTHTHTHTHMLRVWSCNIWLSLGFVMEAADAGGSPHPRGHQVLEEVGEGGGGRS